MAGRKPFKWQLQAEPVDESVYNPVGIVGTQYLGSVVGKRQFDAAAKITGLLLRKST
jgi:hypothetical protein